MAAPCGWYSLFPHTDVPLQGVSTTGQPCGTGAQTSTFRRRPGARASAAPGRGYQPLARLDEKLLLIPVLLSTGAEKHLFP